MMIQIFLENKAEVVKIPTGTFVEQIVSDVYTETLLKFQVAVNNNMTIRVSLCCIH